MTINDTGEATRQILAAAEARGAAAERERIRRELQEVECICFSLACTGDFGGECAGSLDEAEYFTVEVHDHRCAAALAVRICLPEP